MSSAARLEETTYTIDDIEALPDGQRAELIDGELYMMSPPLTNHQRILTEMVVTISNYIKSKKGKCEVIPAPFGVYLFADSSTFVEPDISVICDPVKVTEKGCIGAPDWIIEIVSPSSKTMDYFIKLQKYREAGVKEYWIVNPEEQTVLVYFFAEEPIIEHHSFNDSIRVRIYEDFQIDFSQLKM
jgi:Uma2 family endonuclease